MHFFTFLHVKMIGNLHNYMFVNDYFINCIVKIIGPFGKERFISTVFTTIA